MDLGGGIGIHATPYENSLGSQASHGCIRMDPNDAGQLFNEIKVGTPVFIID
jgi:L,D-transpeptidase ErfK/SrfK